MSDLATRVKTFGYIAWARSMRPIERYSPRTKDRIVMFITRIHVAWYRRQPNSTVGLAAPTLLLTVPGRKTGEPRTQPLFYMADGDRYVVVDSYGGDHRHPQWFYNLMAAKEATIQLGERRQTVTAELADGAERAALWPRLLEMWPSYTKYQELCQDSRQLAVVVLTPS